MICLLIINIDGRRILIIYLLIKYTIIPITIGFWSGVRTCSLKINIYTLSASGNELKDACIILKILYNSIIYL